MKLNLNKTLTDLDGTVIKDGLQDATMFRFVAKALAIAQAGDPIKCYDLALKFYSGAPLSLDDSDFAFVRDIVEKSAYVPMVKAPILKELDLQKLTAAHRQSDNSLSTPSAQ